MMIARRILFSAMFLLSLTLVIGGFAGCGSESSTGPDGTQMAPVDPDTVPNIVEAAKGEFPNASKVEVIGVEEEEEDGQVVYEVKMSVDGVSYEVEVTSDGDVLEVEEDDDDDDVENENEADDDDDDEEDDDDEIEHEEEGKHEGENGA